MEEIAARARETESAEDDVLALIAAGLDQDEAAARDLTRGCPGPWSAYRAEVRDAGGSTVAHDEYHWDALAHLARHDPARVLREVTAKRAIIGEQTSDHAPVESIYGLVCRTCVDWQDAPWAEGGETEFGIAISQQWPCGVARMVLASWPDQAR